MNVSVYTELMKAGLTEGAADEVAEAVRVTRQDLVTKRDLAEFEARLTRTTLITLIAMTGIFAGFVAAMAWVIKS